MNPSGTDTNKKLKISAFDSNFSFLIFIGFENRRSHLNSQHIDPMIYPLLFSRGECGWYPNLTGFDKNSKQNKLTTLQYYNYKLSIRENFNS